ncbi:MAG: hypothetical protein BWY76_00387 [bacterium ADurb.Bin429]|nr:MAG: hypothetical protein BWY76_00387 [bacterium ADurb.Bin429]
MQRAQALDKLAFFRVGILKRAFRFHAVGDVTHVFDHADHPVGTVIAQREGIQLNPAVYLSVGTTQRHDGICRFAGLQRAQRGAILTGDGLAVKRLITALAH